MLRKRHGCQKGACPACAGHSIKGKEPAWEGSSGHDQQASSRGARQTEGAPKPQRKGWDWAADGASQPLHLLASRQRPSRVGAGASEGSAKGHGAKQQRRAPGELQHGRLTRRAGLSASYSSVKGQGMRQQKRVPGALQHWQAQGDPATYAN